MSLIHEKSFFSVLYFSTEISEILRSVSSYLSVGCCHHDVTITTTSDVDCGRFAVTGVTDVTDDTWSIRSESGQRLVIMSPLINFCSAVIRSIK